MSETAAPYLADGIAHGTRCSAGLVLSTYTPSALNDNRIKVHQALSGFQKIYAYACVFGVCSHGIKAGAVSVYVLYSSSLKKKEGNEETFFQHRESRIVIVRRYSIR